MSTLRKRFVRPLSRSPRCCGEHFTSEEELRTVYDENAEEMHVLVDRMKRGATPSTHVAQYSSMLCSDSKELLSNPPLQVNDPTDVPLSDLESVELTNDVEPNITD